MLVGQIVLALTLWCAVVHTFPTLPLRRGCAHNGRIYQPRTEIERGDDGNRWCWGVICDSEGKLIPWDNFKCALTTTVPPTTTEAPTTTTVAPTTGCLYEGRNYGPGENIYEGTDNNWCFGAYCNKFGEILHWDNFDCFPTTLPITTTPATPTIVTSIDGEEVVNPNDVHKGLFKRSANWPTTSEDASLDSTDTTNTPTTDPEDTTSTQSTTLEVTTEEDSLGGFGDATTYPEEITGYGDTTNTPTTVPEDTTNTPTIALEDTTNMPITTPEDTTTTSTTSLETTTLETTPIMCFFGWLSSTTTEPVTTEQIEITASESTSDPEDTTTMPTDSKSTTMSPKAAIDFESSSVSEGCRYNGKIYPVGEISRGGSRHWSWGVYCAQNGDVLHWNTYTGSTVSPGTSETTTEPIPGTTATSIITKRKVIVPSLVAKMVRL